MTSDAGTGLSADAPMLEPRMAPEPPERPERPEHPGPPEPSGQEESPPSGAMPWRVRPARAEDIRQIDALIRELAEYEREPEAVLATGEDLGAALFSSHPRVHCHVVEAGGPGGSQVVGMAIWYVTYSTWRGRHGLWLEDLYVQPAHRGAGAGRALLKTLARVCTERGYARMEWWVLDWNEPAHRFYRSFGAVPQDEWTVWRVDDDRLRVLGST
jgi:GNAT superfamily N-acetyltransferase